MKFKQKGRPLTNKDFDKICDYLEVTESQVWAVLTVETRGFGFFNDRSPQILFERHIFHRQTGGRYDQEHPAISSDRWGGYKGGVREYSRLRKAMKLDKNAALESCSWGIGQIMGFNHEIAGFAHVQDMVKAMVESEHAQLLAIANFIIENNLAKALRRNNWVSFARGYNGRDFKRNEYDTRLAAAHAKYTMLLPDLVLRSTQAALQYLKFNPGPIDGLRGRKTRSALVEFQKQYNLPATGELDRETELQVMEAAEFIVEDSP